MKYAIGLVGCVGAGFVVCAAWADDGNATTLAARVRALEMRLNDMDRRSPVLAAGTVVLTIPGGQAYASKRVKFTHPQPEHAIVLTGQTGSAGHFLFATAEAVSREGFKIAICTPEPVKKPYSARIGYLVVNGTGSPEKPRRAK